MSEPIKVARTDDLIEEWYCDPPEVGIAYRVVRQEWDLLAVPPVRRIYEVVAGPRLTPG